MAVRSRRRAEVEEEEFEENSGKEVHRLTVAVSGEDWAFLRDLAARQNRTFKDLLLEGLRNLRQSYVDVGRLSEIVRSAIDAAVNGVSKDSVCLRAEFSDLEKALCGSVYDGVSSAVASLRSRFESEKADLVRGFESEKAELVKRCESEKAALYGVVKEDLMSRIDEVLDIVADYLGHNLSERVCMNLDDADKVALCIKLYHAVVRVLSIRDSHSFRWFYNAMPKEERRDVLPDVSIDDVANAVDRIVFSKYRKAGSPFGLSYTYTE